MKNLKKIIYVVLVLLTLCVIFLPWAPEDRSFVWFGLAVVVGIFLSWIDEINSVLRASDAKFQNEQYKKTSQRGDFWNEQYRKLMDKKRFSYLIEKKQLMIRSWNNYELRNSNVIISYDFKKKVLKVYDRKIKGKYAVIDWYKEIKSFYSTDPYQLQETFYRFCDIFCETFAYNGVVSTLSKLYEVDEVFPKIKPKPTIKYPETIKVIDINNADENEISTLPGLNIVTAKKIIRYRDLHGGFQTKKEFYAVAKIKERYLERIESKIILLEPDMSLINYSNKKGIDNKERIIDI